MEEILFPKPLHQQTNNRFRVLHQFRKNEKSIAPPKQSNNETQKVGNTYGL